MGAPENPFAFPSPDDGRPSDGYGMTLRDWFAGQVLAVVLENNADGGCVGTFADEGARVAYHVADAMLAARTVQS